MTEPNKSRTDWRTVHRRLNTDYLFSEDLKGRTKVDVEIIDSGVAKLKDRSGKSKEMPWLLFKGSPKRLALGATMCKTMTTLTGTITVTPNPNATFVGLAATRLAVMVIAEDWTGASARRRRRG